MKVVSSVGPMQRLALQWKAQRKTVALVPTMGYLHAGHVSLIERARKAVGKKGIVVVSIYVNPTQFAAGEDLSRYPRDLPRDKALCSKAGVDFLFVPTDSEIYPGKAEGTYSTGKESSNHYRLFTESFDKESGGNRHYTIGNEE